MKKPRELKNILLEVNETAPTNELNEEISLAIEQFIERTGEGVPGTMNWGIGLALDGKEEPAFTYLPLFMRAYAVYEACYGKRFIDRLDIALYTKWFDAIISAPNTPITKVINLGLDDGEVISYYARFEQFSIQALKEKYSKQTEAEA